jgi:hypothetical protein
VKEIYVDETGVTVLTDTSGVSELYVMVFEGDGWKVDGHKPGQRRKN